MSQGYFSTFKNLHKFSHHSYDQHFLKGHQNQNLHSYHTISKNLIAVKFLNFNLMCNPFERVNLVRFSFPYCHSILNILESVYIIDANITWPVAIGVRECE